MLIILHFQREKTTIQATNTQLENSVSVKYSKLKIYIIKKTSLSKILSLLIEITEGSEWKSQNHSRVNFISIINIPLVKMYNPLWLYLMA